MLEDTSSVPRPNPLISAADYYELAPIAKGEGVALPPAVAAAAAGRNSKCNLTDPRKSP
jgi:hypothetical protein